MFLANRVPYSVAFFKTNLRPMVEDAIGHSEQKNSSIGSTPAALSSPPREEFEGEARAPFSNSGLL